MELMQVINQRMSIRVCLKKSFMMNSTAGQKKSEVYLSFTLFPSRVNMGNAELIHYILLTYDRLYFSHGLTVFAKTSAR